MQVTETHAEGLKHQFKVVLAKTDLDARVNARLDELKDRVRINGFRPGKVPLGHLKRVYGKAVMAEAIEAAVRETNAQIATDRGFRLAMEPKVDLPEAEAEVTEVIEGRSDLSYSVTMETLPKIELGNFRDIEVEKLVADVGDAQIDEAIKMLAEQNKPFQTKPAGAAAETGDKVTVSFTGTIEGKPFEGGAAEDIGVEIGSGAFIPGFEEQLVGMTAGETRTVTTTFPTNYLSAELAGKTAVFEVTAKSIEAPGTAEINEAFAASLGLESLDKLREAIKARIAQELAGVTRQRLKRTLLDKLDAMHSFELPHAMVEDEFQNVWRTVTGDLEQQKRTFEDEGTTEEKAQADYRKLAERRVRLGLVLAEIGERNQIKVSDEELTRAVVERSRQFAGQEQKVWDYYRNNPQAVAALRAPIFEDKVIDFLAELAKVTERKVTPEELRKMDEEDETA